MNRDMARVIRSINRREKHRKGPRKTHFGQKPINDLEKQEALIDSRIVEG